MNCSVNDLFGCDAVTECYSIQAKGPDNQLYALETFLELSGISAMQEGFNLLYILKKLNTDGLHKFLEFLKILDCHPDFQEQILPAQKGNCMTINKRIQILRIAAGFSQKQFSSYIGISHKTLPKYESGDIINIPVNSLEAIAKTSRCSMDYLLGYEVADLYNAMYPAGNTETDNNANAVYSYLLNQSADENLKILNLFIRMNHEGRQKLIEFAEILAKHPHYAV